MKKNALFVAPECPRCPPDRPACWPWRFTEGSVIGNYEAHLEDLCRDMRQPLVKIRTIEELQKSLGDPGSIRSIFTCGFLPNPAEPNKYTDIMPLLVQFGKANQNIPIVGILDAMGNPKNLMERGCTDTIRVPSEDYAKAVWCCN